jgi:S-phase kinase-associated protein 1
MKLLTYDKKNIEYPDNLIYYSVFLSNLPNYDETVELNNKSCSLIIMKNIIYFLKHHDDFIKNNKDKNYIIKWNNRFFDLPDNILFEIIEASCFLDIDSLFELSCNEVVNTIKKCNTPNDVRKRFNIKDDITPEEKQEIYKLALSL